MFQAIINDNGHIYTCESSEKHRVVSFMEWFLDSVAGPTSINIVYREKEMPPPPAPSTISVPKAT